MTINSWQDHGPDDHHVLEPERCVNMRSPLSDSQMQLGLCPCTSVALTEAANLYYCGSLTSTNP